MFDLSGKRALVTGASGGIGGAIASAFKQQGAKVIVSGTRKEVLEGIARKLGEGVFAISSDLSDVAGADALVKSASDLVGDIDILVNNAGLNRDMLAVRMKDEDWQAVLDVNLMGTFRLSRASLRGMMKNRWGRIISITSVVGITGNAGQTNYAASKAGIIGLSKALAQEVASRGITVNCIAPGFIKTAMTDKLNERQTEDLLGRIPFGRMGTAEEVASAAVYLASNQAEYITGHTLHVNGGMVMV